MTAVLDSSAIVAIALGEAGADAAIAALPDSVVSAVNLAETIDVLSRQRLDGRSIRRTLRSLALTIVPFDEDLAERAGELAARTRGLGLSLGDRACIALAEQTGGVAVTADRRWTDAALGIEIQLIR